MTNDTNTAPQKSGWAKHPFSKVWHYFHSPKGQHSASICGAFELDQEQTSEGLDAHPANCKTCIRMVADLKRSYV